MPNANIINDRRHLLEKLQGNERHGPFTGSSVKVLLQILQTEFARSESPTYPYTQAPPSQPVSGGGSAATGKGVAPVEFLSFDYPEVENCSPSRTCTRCNRKVAKNSLSLNRVLTCSSNFVHGKSRKL